MFSKRQTLFTELISRRAIAALGRCGWLCACWKHRDTVNGIPTLRRKGQVQASAGREKAP